MENAAISSNVIDRAPVATVTADRGTRYSRVAMALHWLIAALVFSTIPLGLYSASSGSAPPRPALGLGPPPTPATGASLPRSAGSRPALPPPKSAAQQSATNIHKTIGIVILSLTVLRVGWRLTHRPPALPEGMSRPVRWLAKASHALFYVLLLVMPLSGWWMSSAVPNPMRHAFGFGIFDIPFLPVTQAWASAGAARFIHVNLVWVMVGLIGLHVCAALKHQFIDKDDILARMLPNKSPSPAAAQPF